MLKFLKENRIYIILLFIIAIVYFVLRLPNLTLQPIFADEAIYVRWAQVMKAEPTLRFLPMSDGKTPLFMWIMIPFFKIFSDPLFAGRFLSILSGFLTLLGVLFLGWKFFSKKAGIWAAFLISITPFMVFFDRMALVDSMLAAFSIWSLNLALLLIKYQRIDLAMVLGYILGGGFLVKPPGVFSILTVPATLLVFNWRSGNLPKRLLKLFGLWAVAVFIAFVIINLLRLGPGFSGLGGRNSDYVFSPTKLLINPLDPFWPHLKDVADWFMKYMTIPVTSVVLGGVSYAFWKKNLVALTVLAWCLVPLVAEMLFLQTFTARYILFTIPPLLLLSGWLLSEVSNKLHLKRWIFPSLVGVLLLPLALSFNLRLLADPASVPLPKNERRGYLEDWTAGYGFPQIAQYLMDQAQSGAIVVGTEGYFGTLPDGLQIYLEKYFHSAPKDKQIIVIGGKGDIINVLRESSLDQPTYFLANKARVEGTLSDVVLLRTFPKAVSEGNTPDAIMLYKIIPR